MIITCPSCSARYPVDEASFPPSGRKVRCAKCGNSWHQKPVVEPPPAAFRMDPSKPPMFARQAAKPAAKSAPAEDETAPEPEAVSAPEAVAEDAPPAKPSEPETSADDIDFADEAAPAEPVKAPEEPVEDPNKRRARVVPTVMTEMQSGTGGRLRAFVNEAATSRRDRILLLLGWSLLGLFVLGTLMAIFSYRKEIVAMIPGTAKVYEAAGAPVNLQGIEFRNVTYERQTENDLPVLAVLGEVVNVSGETRTLPRLRVGLRDKDQNELYHWTFALPERSLAADAKIPFVTRLSSPPIEARDIEVRFVLPSENEASLPPPEMTGDETTVDEAAAPAEEDAATTDASDEAASAEPEADVEAPVDVPVEGGH
ncbi:MAG: hypothetical protein GC184_02360 [Rhizobiales bacterium]|nr:hypothetical protein [Hyphomicrobiales bacterium]